MANITGLCMKLEHSHIFPLIASGFDNGSVIFKGGIVYTRTVEQFIFLVLYEFKTYFNVHENKTTEA